MLKGATMRKFMFTIVLIFLLSPYALFALASPVDLQLNTTIPAVSTLQVNGGTDTATFTPGTPLTIPYTYFGNQLVKMQITSANGFNLRHTLYETYNTWVIPYTMTFDYGSGTQTTVVNGSSVNLIDYHGTYDLAKNMVFSAENINYAAGSYSDIITFEVIAQ
jgi:hypothetical protein